MSERGVFAIDRGIWDHPVFADEPLTEREAWCWLIGEASFRNRTRNISGRILGLERGQLAASVRFLADRWKWSKSRVHRFLKRLKTETMIGTDDGTGILVITINNYEKFQRVSLPSRDTKQDGHRDTDGTVAGQQRDKTEDTESIELDLGSTRERARPTSDWDFDRFWQRYPHKVGKQDAAKAFQVAKRSGKPFDDVLSSIDRYIATKPKDRAYCNPATWLRGGRWDDAPAPEPDIPAFLDRRIAGSAPRPGSREDTRERTVNALRSLDPFPYAHDAGRGEGAGAPIPGQLSLVKPT